MAAKRFQTRTEEETQQLLPVSDTQRRQQLSVLCEIIYL